MIEKKSDYQTLRAFRCQNKRIQVLILIFATLFHYRQSQKLSLGKIKLISESANN